ncbi:cytochrome c3 family protein [Croceicoccus sediminis]|uniref:cytochrome c3 family protein n=1 Tax=Croceicoccus sediminis TaxID=2571150 RepID=UPI001183F5C3|nr:cytochrome c3 family protein [Croceicoccus sediminis]
MTFLIRQIALKASGEEIVRATTVEGDTITIGRDASCDIHLPDLAVDPRHARAVMKDGELFVESIADQPFEVNGRSVNRRAIDLSRGAELTFGGHRINVERGEGGVPVFTVRRVEAISDVSEEKDLGSVYTLKGLMPGKRMSAWGFAILVLLACLAWPIGAYVTHKGEKERGSGYHGDEIWSSGDLTLAHEKLKDDCQACHVDAFVAVRDNACMTCHEDDAHAHIAGLAANDATARLVAARGEPGPFGQFQRAVAEGFNRPAGRCVECHIEHTGAGAMEATPQKFCTDCHDGMSKRLPDTKLPDASDFGTGHPEFHPALVVEPGNKPVFQRVALTKNTREDSGLKFTHAEHMSKAGGVAQMVRRRPGEYDGRDAMQCADCHTLDSTKVRFEPVKMEESCQSCHALGLEMVDGTTRTLRHGKPELVAADLRAFYRSGNPPRPASLSGMSRRSPGDGASQRTARDFARAVQFFPARADGAVTRVFSKGGACYDCHVVTRDGPAVTNGFDIVPAVQNDRYFEKGWFTHDAHSKYECTDCHVEATRSNDAGRVMIPGLGGEGGCRTCHVGGTGASLAKVNHPVESDCAMCHDYHADDGPPWMAKPKRTVAGADRPKSLRQVSLR